MIYTKPWEIFEFNNAWTLFRRSLNKKQKIIADTFIDRLEENGTNLSMPFSSAVKGYENLFALRPKNARLFYFFLPGGDIVIVLGAIKGKKERKLRPEIYAEAANLKERVENLGNILWNRLSPLN